MNKSTFLTFPFRSERRGKFNSNSPMNLMCSAIVSSLIPFKLNTKIYFSENVKHTLQHYMFQIHAIYPEEDKIVLLKPNQNLQDKKITEMIFLEILKEQLQKTNYNRTISE
jgi:hypothetical protein